MCCIKRKLKNRTLLFSPASESEVQITQWALLCDPVETLTCSAPASAFTRGAENKLSHNTTVSGKKKKKMLALSRPFYTRALKVCVCVCMKNMPHRVTTHRATKTTLLRNAHALEDRWGRPIGGHVCTGVTHIVCLTELNDRSTQNVSHSLKGL